MKNNGVSNKKIKLDKNDNNTILVIEDKPNFDLNEHNLQFSQELINQNKEQSLENMNGFQEVSPMEALLNRARLKREYILKDELNDKEKSDLLESWKQNYMADFNNWLQLVNCQIDYDTIELNPNSKDLSIQIIKAQLIHENPEEPNFHLYQCNISCQFIDFPEIQTIQVISFGKSKKLAKKNAKEVTTKKIMDMGLIRLGLKNKDFNKQKNKNDKQNSNEKNTNKQQNQVMSLKKEIKKINKELQEHLLQDNYFMACVCLVQIVNKKQKVEWKELSKIWYYALKKSDINYIIVILQIITKQKQSSTLQTYNCSSVSQLSKITETKTDVPEISKIDEVQKFNNEIILQYQEYSQQNKEQINLESILQQINETSNKQTSKRQAEEVRSIHYISYQILDEMYESLLYLSNLRLQLAIADEIYVQIEVQPDDFQSLGCSQYYMNKKNMMMVEMIESIYQIYCERPERQGEYGVSLLGVLSLHGMKHELQVCLFTPEEMKELVTQKLFIKGNANRTDSYNMIAEGEVVLLKQEQGQVQSGGGGGGERGERGERERERERGERERGEKERGEREKERGERERESERTECNQKEEQILGVVIEVDHSYKCKVAVMMSDELGLGVERGELFRLTKLINRTSSDKTIERYIVYAYDMQCGQNEGDKLGNDPQLSAGLHTSHELDIGKYERLNEIINNNICIYNEQNRAIQTAMNQILTLIQGPPGTGKTTTAVNIVRQWIIQDPYRQILVCADSNIAVDLLYNEFMRMNLKTIRLGQSDTKQKHYRFVGQNSQYSLLRKQISNADIVCTTCVGSTSELLAKLDFTRVLVDEATQATELTTMVPLGRQCQQLVLIGDHKQLPPTVLSLFAQTKGMSISLFERLIKQGVESILLTVQYRMHPSLALYPNHQFYNNMLLNGVNDSHRPIILGFQWPNPNLRLSILHTQGQEISFQSSLQNNLEVLAVIQILKQILQVDVIRLHQIGIITPYNAQKKKLRLMIHQEIRLFPAQFGINVNSVQQMQTNVGNLIDVDTIDGYQGMERELIIFSTVRSNYKGELGFMKDPRRLNVALTRAKRGLIIVGDTGTLSQDTYWKNFIDWAKQHHSVVNFTQQTFNHA